MDDDRLLNGRTETLIGKHCDRHPELELPHDQQVCPECGGHLRLVLQDDETGRVRIS